MSLRGEPKYPQKIYPDLAKSIFERTFYFCKLSNISIKEYIEILKEECKKRGIENDFLL